MIISLEPTPYLSSCIFGKLFSVFLIRISTYSNCGAIPHELMKYEQIFKLVHSLFKICIFIANIFLHYRIGCLSKCALVRAPFTLSSWRWLKPTCTPSLCLLTSARQNINAWTLSNRSPRRRFCRCLKKIRILSVAIKLHHNCCWWHMCCCINMNFLPTWKL